MRVRGDLLPELGLLAALVALVVALAATEVRFRSSENVLEILSQSATVLIVAVPFAMLLIARHIDLSVGSSIALCGVVGAGMMSDGAPVLLACAVVMAIATAIGTFNGVLCTYLRFSPIVVTLGMLALLRGAAFVLRPESYQSGLPDSFAYLGQGRFVVGDVPIKVVVAACVAAAGFAFLDRMRKGRHVRALGANPRAAFLSGIRVNRTALGVYAATGAAVGLAALITVSELDSGPPDIADGFEITVLTAVLLGGVAFTGGRGSIAGVVLGVLFIQTLSNGFTHWGLTTDEVRLANGAVLVAAAGMQALTTWGGQRRRAGVATGAELPGLRRGRIGGQSERV